MHVEHHGKDLQPLLAALPQVMREARAAGARVELVLSNAFMRYAIVPNPDGAANGEELTLLCRHAFQRVHGDVVAQWSIQLSLAALGGNGLASAVDQDWLDALAEHVKTEKGQLTSVQPVLAHAFNRLAKVGQDGIFVLREPERLCLLAWQNRSWSAVQLQPVLADWQATLDAGLHRLRLQLALPETTPVQLCELVQGDVQLRMTPWWADWSMAGGIA
ncbi:hypothetical protein ACKF11_04420 [Methylobacillus sp. Pita2]